MRVCRVLVARGLTIWCAISLVLGGCGGAEAHAESGDAGRAHLVGAGEASLGTARPAARRRSKDQPTVEPHRVGPGGRAHAGCAEVLWCASGGAALVGDPVLDEKERVYVVTSDGYLHAFERDGRFRFSYTVKGTPLGSVSLRPSDGAILMGTTAGLIYAINQSGGLYFRHATPTSVWSGLHALNDSAVTFLGLDFRLYALRNSGEALYRVRAPFPPTTEPVVAEGDVVWVGMAGAVARFVAAYRLERLPLSAEEGFAAPVEQIVTVGKAAVARASGRAYFIVSGQPPLDLGAVSQMGSDQRRFALVGAQEGEQLVRVLEALDPHPVPQTIASWNAGTAPMSGEVTIAGTQLLLPRETGVMSIYDEGRLECSAQVSTSPLRKAILGKSKEFFVTADQAGQFCAVALNLP